MNPTASPAGGGDRLVGEAIELLRALVRLDTVSSPGCETPAVEILRGYFEAAGIECGVYARDPGRANLVARIRGREPDAPRLLFLSHLDTVGARPEDWSHDPWSGDLADGHVWGRGSLDMKSHAAAAAVALAELARQGVRPVGDILFAATADEEIGDADIGIAWLCREHPDAIRAEWCVNEGAGSWLEARGERFALCSVGEKTSSPFVLRVRGVSAHASRPDGGDNALVKAAPVLAALGRVELPPRLLPEMEEFFAAVVGRAGPVEDVLADTASVDAALGSHASAATRATVAPTLVAASTQRNVIPDLCEITCDCRRLPGQPREEVENAVRGALGGLDVELEWLDERGGSSSPTGTRLWTALEAFVRDVDGARLVPMLLPAFTDSHHVRAAFGTTAYGFFPTPSMPLAVSSSLIHGVDERIAVADLGLAVRCFLHVARALEAA